METAVSLVSFSFLHTLQYPPSDTGSPSSVLVSRSALLCYSLKLPAQNPCPTFSSGDSYKKATLSSDMVVQLSSPSQWKGTVYNGKVRQESTFFSSSFYFLMVEMVSVERTGEADTCEGCCPLLVHSACAGSHSCLLVWSFPLSVMSPAGEEEGSCFIDWIDYFKQQCLIRISWTNSIRNSFWKLQRQRLWSGSLERSFLIVTNGLECYTIECSAYSYPIFWEC